MIQHRDHKTVAAGRGEARLPMVLLGHEHEHLSILQREDETRYVLAARGQVGRRLTVEEEARWPTWFEQIKDSIADFGNRVGQVRELGDGGTGGAVMP